MKKLMALMIVISMLPFNMAGYAVNALAADSPITIYVAGDSTAATYAANRAPLTGWAQVLGDFLPDNIVVENHAQSGRSSKSFVDEGRLDTIINKIKAGDYLIIQFGHNDQKTDDPARYTNPATTYKDYLKMYIDRSRQKGAIPILVTSIERRRVSGSSHIETLGDYPKAMRELAAAEDVTLIDLSAETLKLYNSLGVEGTKRLFLIVAPGESPNYPDGLEDNTHLCRYGAEEISKLFIRELAKTDLPIAAYLEDLEFPEEPGEPEEPEEPVDDDKEMITLLEEDFDKVPSEEGQLVFGWNGWTAMAQNASNKDDDSDYRIISDPENPENKLVSFYRPNGLADTTKNYFMIKKMEGTLNTGYLSVRFDVRAENSLADYFQVRLYDHTDGSKNLQFQVAFNNSTIGDIKANGKLFRFDGATSNRPAPRNKWFSFEIFLDLYNNRVSYYEGDNFLGEAELHSSFAGANASQILFGTHRVVPAGGLFYLDNIVVEQVPFMAVTNSSPKNGDSDVDVYGDMKVVFRNRIDSDSLQDATILVNGGTDLIERTEIDAVNQKVLNIYFKDNLAFNTNYNVSISGIQDEYGQTISQTNIAFKTRSKQTLFETPNFYIGDDNITYTNISGGDLRCVIRGINEQETDASALMIAALFRGNELLTASFDEKVFEGGSSEYKNLETLIPVPGNTQDLSVRVFVWDSFTGRRPLTQSYVFDDNGLSVGAPVKKGNTVSSVFAQADHESGVISIEGMADETEVTVFALYPDFDLEDLTVQNAAEALEFVGQVASADGGYSFQYALKGGNRHDGRAHKIYVRNRNAVSVKLFGSTQLGAVLNAVTASTVSQLEAMLARNNPKTISGGIVLSEVLQIDLEKYYGIIDKTDVLNEIAGKTFANIGALRAALTSAIDRRAEAEQNEQALINSINQAEWDELYDIFVENNEMLQINFGGRFAELIKAEKTTLYKRLAADFTFTSIREIRNAFSRVVDEIINGRKSGGGGGGQQSGGSQTTISGGKAPVPTTSPQPVNPADHAFSDISDVLWAAESIEKLSELKIIEGVGQNRFAPHEKVTREQFVKMLVLAFGMMDDSAEVDFQDVNKGDWYYPYIASGVKKGIIQGMGDGSFGVGRSITRAEMAVLACRAVSAAGITLPKAAEPADFADIDEIPEYAREYVREIQQANIMSGVGNLRFAPNEGSTRAMAAKVIYGILGLVS